jgi:hypothetical protein
MIGIIIFIGMIITGYILSQKYFIYDIIPKNTYKRKFIELTKINKDNINIEIKNEQNDDDIEVNYDEWTPLSLK